MKILRTPGERFENIKGYPFEPHYTTIKTHDKPKSKFDKNKTEKYQYTIEDVDF